MHLPVDMSDRTLEIDFNVNTFESNTGWHGQKHRHAVLRAKGLSKCNCKAPAENDTSKSSAYMIHFKGAWIRKLVDNFLGDRSIQVVQEVSIH